ncbi:hypothetical protein AMECASPLE_005301 [Ameca splendens]|uniref:Uncharacterized protein n=1 Tax=Ameca splendens TaxID=208324 RepID=A0ABV1A6G3_9TELE
MRCQRKNHEGTEYFFSCLQLRVMKHPVPHLLLRIASQLAERRPCTCSPRLQHREIGEFGNTPRPHKHGAVTDQNYNDKHILIAVGIIAAVVPEIKANKHFCAKVF